MEAIIQACHSMKTMLSFLSPNFYLLLFNLYRCFLVLLNFHILYSVYGFMTLSQTLDQNMRSGYNAPEVAMSGRYTLKSDVYSFGVVMLELLTGRKPLDR